jgi:hypothetical protein
MARRLGGIWGARLGFGIWASSAMVGRQVKTKLRECGWAGMLFSYICSSSHLIHTYPARLRFRRRRRTASSASPAAAPARAGRTFSQPDPGRRARSSSIELKIYILTHS